MLAGMDYAEITQDFMGLGAYDFAAARMFYGDTASVFKDEALSTENRFRGGLFNKLDNFGGILGFHSFQVPLHHALFSIANFYSLISGCDPVIPLNRRLKLGTGGTGHLASRIGRAAGFC